MNVKSIGISWLIALLLLGAFSLIKQPKESDSGIEQRFQNEKKSLGIESSTTESKAKLDTMGKRDSSDNQFDKDAATTLFFTQI